MKTAYRVPDNDCQCIAPGATPDKTKSVGTLKIRSFITSLRGGETERQGEAIVLRGIAFDSGAGLAAVDISDDGGKHWQPATLKQSLGKYSFHEWQAAWKPREKGSVALLVRARNRLGEQQPTVSTWNPGGYMRNAVEAVPVRVV